MVCWGFKVEGLGSKAEGSGRRVDGSGRGVWERVAGAVLPPARLSRIIRNGTDKTVKAKIWPYYVLRTLTLEPMPESDLDGLICAE